MWKQLNERAELGKFQFSVGSTHAMNSGYLINDDNTASTAPSREYDEESLEENYEREIIDDLLEGALDREIYLYDIMDSAIQGRRHQGFKPKHLSKIWRIYIKTAKIKMDTTSQTSVRTDNPKISKNYGTNDCML